MHHVRQEDLPFKGSSHQFVGADQGNVNGSVFLFSGEPGRVHLSPTFIQENLE